MQQTEPVIIATGITVEEKAATFEFRRRGFVVEHVSQQPSSSNYALTMSKRLVAKIALGLHLPQGPFKKYSRFHQAYIASQAAEVIAHSAGLHVSECWVAHDMADPVMAEGAAQLPSGELLLAANNYFGPQVAIYFGFLDFYTRKLVPLMLVGAVVFVYQVLFGQVDTPLLPVFCVTISLWTTYFLQSWKRRCSELAYAWGVYGSEDKEFIAELAKKAAKESNGEEMRRFASLALLSLLVALQIRVMLFYQHLYTHAHDSVAMYSLEAGYLLFTLTARAAFGHMEAALIEFERHATKAEEERWLIGKGFAFEFVNRYSALIYVAFWLRDLSRARTILAISFTLGAVLDNAQELLLPAVLLRAKALLLPSQLASTAPPKSRRVRTQRTSLSEPDAILRGPKSPLSPLSPLSVSAEEGEEALERRELWEGLVRVEVARPQCNVQSDYLEMVTQFGYLGMFSVAFPLAPLLAYANNAFETSVDLAKLQQSRKPHIRMSSTIGLWIEALEMISLLSGLTNCYLLAEVSANITFFVPTQLHAVLDSDFGRLALMTCVEHLLLLFQLTLRGLISPVPQWMRESLARDSMEMDRQRQHTHMTHNQHAIHMNHSHSQHRDGPTEPTEPNDNEHTVSAERRESRNLKALQAEREKHGHRHSDQHINKHTDKHKSLASPLKGLKGLKGMISPKGPKGPKGSRADAASADRDNRDSNGDSKNGDRGSGSRDKDSGDREQGSLITTKDRDRDSGDRDKDRERERERDSTSVENKDSPPTTAPAPAPAPPDKHKLQKMSPGSEVALSKVLNARDHLYSFDPINLAWLVAAPPALALLGLSPYIYVPLAMLYFSYAQAHKERADRKAAVGIVTDPKLLRLVLEEMPSWVNDSEHQRVEWINTLVQKLWPYLSLALEQPVIAQVQAVLNANPVSASLGVTMRKFSLGSISPKILGVRIYGSKDSSLHMDWELRWAGDPLISMSVGTMGALAPCVQVSQLMLSATIRVELLDITQRLPCISAISVAFMETPKVTFSLKVASVDVMNMGMGPADFSVTHLVRKVIDAVLLDIVIYPKQIKIPLVPTSAGEAHAQPIGILILTLERAINLKKNTYFMGTTDPYCVIDTAQQQFRSRVTCGKARWDETFEIMVYDLDSQCLSISVFDADPGFDKALGKVEVLLRNTRPNQLFQKTLDLEGGQGQGSQGQCGQLLVSYEYLPVRGPDDSDSDSCDGDSCDDEILYRFSREQLTDHILHSEEELLAIQFPQQHSVGPGGGSVGIVTISNMHLRNFKASSLLFTSALKPFVEVSLMGKVKCTRSQPGTTLPHFPETFSFVVRHAERLKLRVEVRNKRKLSLLNAQSLGWVEIPLSDVVENSGLREQEYLMDGTNHECYVSLKISLSSSFQD